MLTHSDIASLMRGAAPAIRDLVVATVQPLVERIAELDQTVAGLRKELAERDEPAEAVTPEQAASMIADAIAGLPVAQDGQSVTPEDILPLIEETVSRAVSVAVAGIPAPKDGEPGMDADMEAIADLVREEVASAVDAIPKPQDGRSVTVEELEPVIQERLSATLAEALKGIPAPKDGRDGKDGADGRDGLDAVTPILRDGELLWTMSDGSVRELGRVRGEDGAPGKDGRDGFGFDDLDLVEADEGLSLRFARDEIVKEFPLPVIVDRGVFKSGIVYRKGNGVTWGGSFWIAQQDNPPGKPDSPDSGWRLAVKRGRDGKEPAK